MNQEHAIKFKEACKRVILDKHDNPEETEKTIGLLNEKALHSICKYYFEPDARYHEIKIGRRIADIYNAQGDIIEIQTRSLGKIKDKLSILLESHRVTLVYPMAAKKWIRWVNPETGELGKAHVSPKKVTLHDALFELVSIRELTSHENLRLIILLLEVNEYRYLNGTSGNKKRGSKRCNTIPISLLDEVHIKKTGDYRVFLPDTLPEKFTSKDLIKENISPKKASLTLNFLRKQGLIQSIGKRGRCIEYVRYF